MPAEVLDWFCLRFPRQVDVGDVQDALTALNGLGSPGRQAVTVLQVAGRQGRLEHHLAVGHRRAAAVRAQLLQAVPGLNLETVDNMVMPPLSSTWRLWLSTRRRPLSADDPERLARRLLVALVAVEQGEYLLLRWTLGPVRRPMVVGDSLSTSKTESWIGLATAPLLPPGRLDGEARRVLRDKQGRPGWRAVGIIAVRAASTARERQLVAQLLGALRTTQGPGVQVGLRRCWRPARATPAAPLRWPLALNVDELTGLVAFPIGDDSRDLPVHRQASRLLPPVTTVPSTGRVVAEATYPGRERPLALSARDATFHTHLLGPTGSGKSVTISNLVLQDIAAGHGVVVIDPKGDLVTDVLARVPAKRIPDVVVIDPSDPAPVGLNPLARAAAPELVADQLLTVFRGLYESWGPRVEAVLTAGLITLARTENMTLAALPLLLTNAAFRKRLVSKLHDPLGLGEFWAGYERLSEPERQQVIAPALNRVRPFLLRPQLRAVVGQAKPRFELGQVFTERKILLVSLGRGLLGPDVANLLGGLIVSQLWNTILARQTVAAERRHPVQIFVDEFQDILHLNTPLPDVLAQARGMGVGFTLAHQHLGQLPKDVKAAVLANARSRVIWQLGADDAGVLARTSRRLEADDITSLGRFEVYLSLVSGGHVSPLMSGRTRALPPEIQDPEVVRASSRQRYGILRDEVESRLQALFNLRGIDDLGDVGTKRSPS